MSFDSTRVCRGKCARNQPECVGLRSHSMKVCRTACARIFAEWARRKKCVTIVTPRPDFHPCAGMTARPAPVRCTGGPQPCLLPWLRLADSGVWSWCNSVCMLVAGAGPSIQPGLLRSRKFPHFEKKSDTPPCRIDFSYCC